MLPLCQMCKLQYVNYIRFYKAEILSEFGRVCTGKFLVKFLLINKGLYLSQKISGLSNHGFFICRLKFEIYTDDNFL